MDNVSGDNGGAATAAVDQMVITRDLSCVVCGYNLRTLEIAGRCPECGGAVEQSLLVLPEPALTAWAIKLAAWAIIVGLAQVCAKPIGLIASFMMLLAAHRLYYRCDLAHMAALGSRIRWLWRTTVFSLFGAFVVLVGQLVAGPMSVFMEAAFGSMLSSRTTTVGLGTVPRAGEGAREVGMVNMAGTLELSNDGRGGAAVRALDPSGNAISTNALAQDTPITIADADGNTFLVTLDWADNVTVTTTPPSGTGPSVSTPRIAFVAAVALFGVAVTVADLAATVLYLLVCRGLAIRAQQARLAGHFRKIMWLFVAGMACVLAALGLAAAGALTALSAARAGRFSGAMSTFLAAAAVVGVSGAGLLLTSSIWQIVASFRLSGALARAPSDLSEIAAAPE